MRSGAVYLNSGYRIAALAVIRAGEDIGNVLDGGRRRYELEHRAWRERRGETAVYICAVGRVRIIRQGVDGRGGHHAQKLAVFVVHHEYGTVSSGKSLVGGVVQPAVDVQGHCKALRLGRSRDEAEALHIVPEVVYYARRCRARIVAERVIAAEAGLFIVGVEISAAAEAGENDAVAVAYKSGGAGVGAGKGQGP